MANKLKGPAENYLKMPNHIRNIPELGYGAKELLAHIYSFGRKGCWQSNETLGKMFFRSNRTVSLWIANLKKGGYILWLHPKGFYRTLWAKSHPDIIISTTLLYRKQEIPKSEIISGQAKSTLLRNNLQSNCAENCEATAQKPVVPLRKKLLHTNNTTKKDTIKDTATPAPLPAGGQASALLEDRKTEQKANIERFKQNFGKIYPANKLTPEQFDQRREQMIKALWASEKIKRFST